MKDELYFLNGLISAILYKKSLVSVPGSIDWNKFVGLVLQNDFIALVFNHLKDIPEIPPQLLEILEMKYHKSLHRSVLQEYYGNQILSRFEMRGIKCLPLKGMILKHLYPQPYMRSMSDLDILIDIDNLQETREIMPQLGFDVYRYDEHHDIYNIRPYVNVELHKLLIVGEMEDYFQIGFERARLKADSSYIYELSIEDFYIHVIGHMAYHFAHGGVGIRLVLDVRVYLDYYGSEMNREYLKKELEKAGLYTFTKHIEKLADIWFLGEKSNEFYDELGEYIVRSGYLGSEKHKEILEVVRQTNNRIGSNARAKAIVKAIFLPYREMAFAYPVLKHKSWLLPFMWIVRWIDVLKKRRENITRIRRLSRISDEDVCRLGKLYDELEMRHLL